MYGMNMIRLHQKVNPDRWYYAAERQRSELSGEDDGVKLGAAGVLLGRDRERLELRWTSFVRGHSAPAELPQR
eukprot:COSAG04_NODE_6973_length_1217_cov_1.505367_3_plen_72_part_01